MLKQRLDTLVLEKGLAKSREQARAYILMGSVWNGETRLDKPGEQVSPNLEIEIRLEGPSFASRAGIKLQHALTQYQLSPAGKVCLDIGASHGGFTDCLLVNGAKHVFAVDVAYGILEYRLRKDERVTLLEKTNARYLERTQLIDSNPLGDQIEWVTLDVSFISLRKIVPQILKLVSPGCRWVFLFKPQFELDKKLIGKGGRVREPKAIDEGVSSFLNFLQPLGFQSLGEPLDSPITGKKSGNREILIAQETPHSQ